MRRSVLVLNLLLALSSSAQFSIGHTTITFNDPSRTGGFGSGGGAGRQIQTEIYYPATSAGDNVPVATGEFPVIVFGHGFVMSWDAYTNIWQHYTAMGYILAFPRTEGGLPDHQAFALDLSIVEQKMMALHTNASSPFYQKINGNSAIMGHSMGGGASFLAADGNTSIKTVIGLAPAETDPSAIAAAPGVTVPALIFSGSSDGVTPPQDHHLPIYNALGSSCKSFISITGGAHCYFANTNFNCDFGESTSSTGITITRTQQQTITYSILDVWLDYMLMGNCAAFDQFQTLTSGGSLYTPQSTCTPNPVPVINASGAVLTSSVTGTAYQWYMNGNLIGGANAVQYTATQNGSYTVVVTHFDGCTTESAPYVITSLSLEEETDILPFISPNPTEGKLMISNLNGIHKEITVTDLSGKEQPFLISGDELDLNQCADGLYVVKINDHYFRIIKGH